MTTGSLALRQLVRPGTGRPHNLRVAVRAGVLLSAVRLLPWALRERRTIRGSRVTEVDVPIDRPDQR